jgi:hypothetical protein
MTASLTSRSSGAVSIDFQPFLPSKLGIRRRPRTSRQATVGHRKI